MPLSNGLRAYGRPSRSRDGRSTGLNAVSTIDEVSDAIAVSLPSNSLSLCRVPVCGTKRADVSSCDQDHLE